MYLPLILCAVISLNVAFADNIPECKKIECAEFELVEKKENYDVRIYKAHKIVSTTTTGYPWWIAENMNFMRLFRYIQGANEKQQKIKMTAPVLSVLNADEKTGTLIKNSFEMSFFTPKAMEELPKPTNEKLELKEFGPVKVYAVRFGGWMTSWKVNRLQKKLREDLIADGVKFDQSKFYTAGYNSPMEFWNRHNDIFYVATAKQQ